MEAKVTIEIEDAGSLVEYVASAKCLAAFGDPVEFDRIVTVFGTPAEPNVEACLTDILSTSIPREAGIAARKIDMTVTNRLRVIPVVAASLSNITKEELKRINAAFEAVPENGTQRCLEDVKHDGMYLSPKDSGFYVRLPSLPETWDEVLPLLTPEMKAIALIAREQGADRIEFDRDEDPTDGLVEFDHEEDGEETAGSGS
jgi:hypothetical protein